MDLIEFRTSVNVTECPICNSETAYFPQHYEMLCTNDDCREPVEYYQTFIAFERSVHTDNGIKRFTVDANLIINGEICAAIFPMPHLSDESGDVAFLQLLHIPKDKQTENIAKIIAEFAKWGRFDWTFSEKKTDLPTLVRLIGYKTYKDRPVPYETERFIALHNAMDIRAEHLAYEFTSIKIGF